MELRQRKPFETPIELIRVSPIVKVELRGEDLDSSSYYHAGLPDWKQVTNNFETGKSSCLGTDELLMSTHSMLLSTI